MNIISVIDNFPEVLYVGPDMIVNSDALSNDAYLALQWSVTGTNNIDLSIKEICFANLFCFVPENFFEN